MGEKIVYAAHRFQDSHDAAPDPIYAVEQHLLGTILCKPGADRGTSSRLRAAALPGPGTRGGVRCHKVRGVNRGDVHPSPRQGGLAAPGGFGR